MTPSGVPLLSANHNLAIRTGRELSTGTMYLYPIGGIMGVNRSISQERSSMYTVSISHASKAFGDVHRSPALRRSYGRGEAALRREVRYCEKFTITVLLLASGCVKIAL